MTPPFHYIAAAIAMCCATIPFDGANAAWYEAQSDHFVIYADDSERDIRRYAENLEKYHSALELLTQHEIEKPSPSNRVVIFVVGNSRDIRQLSGGENRNIAGFYIPRAGGSRAFVQDIRNKNGYPDFSTIILLHEYAHHFLISSQRYAMPRWVSEGAAEFFAAASFNSDGSVLIGRPALHRAGELAYAQDVSIEELLDYDLYRDNRGQRRDAYYGRAWLLYHYLTFNSERSGQRTQYLQEVINGTPSLEAGRRAFGDLGALQAELRNYQRSRRMASFRLTPEMLSASGVTMRRLPEGEAEMMDLRIRSQRGVNAEQAEEIVIEAREIAARYPGDAGVLTALAEAEYDAGHDDAAIAAADAAIAVDPGRANAYVQKGYALFRIAKNSPVPDQAYDAAMTPFSQLNARENDHPLPLIYYYRSYAERGIAPPENARAALERAAELAPFDQQLWLSAAMMQAREGKIGIARASLTPLAADPHGRRSSRIAALLLDVLEEAEEGAPFELSPAMMREAPQVTVDEDGDEDGDEDADSGDQENSAR